MKTVMSTDEAWEIIKKLAFPYKHLAKTLEEKIAIETMEKLIENAKNQKEEL